MEHFEYCYLVHRAHEVLKLHEKAKAEGEEFYAADSFTPLKNGLMAQVLIREINSGEPVKLILRLRHTNDQKDREAMINDTLRVFFEKGCHRVPGHFVVNDVIEYVAYSDHVPEPVRPPTQK